MGCNSNSNAVVECNHRSRDEISMKCFIQRLSKQREAANFCNFFEKSADFG